MIDPAKAQAAALSLFDASCEHVRSMIADPCIASPDYEPLADLLANTNAAARNVIRVRNQIKELEELSAK